MELEKIFAIISAICFWLGGFAFGIAMSHFFIIK